MYEEGICQVTDTFFCKIIEFQDINYELLEVEERGECTGKSIPSLSITLHPSIKFQLFFFNRKVQQSEV